MSVCAWARVKACGTGICGLAVGGHCGAGATPRERSGGQNTGNLVEPLAGGQCIGIIFAQIHRHAPSAENGRQRPRRMAQQAAQPATVYLRKAWGDLRAEDGEILNPMVQLEKMNTASLMNASVQTCHHAVPACQRECAPSRRCCPPKCAQTEGHCLTIRRTRNGRSDEVIAVPAAR